MATDRHGIKNGQWIMIKSLSIVGFIAGLVWGFREPDISGEITVPMIIFFGAIVAFIVYFVSVIFFIIVNGAVDVANSQPSGYNKVWVVSVYLCFAFFFFDLVFLGGQYIFQPTMCALLGCF